jgi:hypothetical protein
MFFGLPEKLAVFSAFSNCKIIGLQHSDWCRVIVMYQQTS